MSRRRFQHSGREKLETGIQPVPVHHVLLEVEIYPAVPGNRKDCKGEDLMPIYEYICKHCNHQFEMIRSTRDLDSDIECPQCSVKGVEKLMSICKAKVEMSFSDFNNMGAGTSGSSCSGCTASSCTGCSSK